MITQLIWTIWTLMSSVPKKADKLNLSLSLLTFSCCVVSVAIWCQLWWNLVTSLCFQWRPLAKCSTTSVAWVYAVTIARLWWTRLLDDCYLLRPVSRCILLIQVGGGENDKTKIYLLIFRKLFQSLWPSDTIRRHTLVVFSVPSDYLNQWLASSSSSIVHHSVEILSKCKCFPSDNVLEFIVGNPVKDILNP